MDSRLCLHQVSSGRRIYLAGNIPQRRHFLSGSSYQMGSRRVAIAVAFSSKSLGTVRWAVDNYLTSRDTVILLHVQPMDELYGADWGHVCTSKLETSHMPMHIDKDPETWSDAELGIFDARDLAQPLRDAQIPHWFHVAQDHDLKERICLEASRLQVQVLIVGSQCGKQGSKHRDKSIGDYCMHHCPCPVVVGNVADINTQIRESMNACKL